MGYQHGKTLFDVWHRSGVVDSMLRDRHQEEFHKTKTGHVSDSQSQLEIRMHAWDLHFVF